MPVYYSLKSNFNVKAINYELHPMTLNELESAETEYGINIKTLLFSAFAYLQSLLNAGDDFAVGIAEYDRSLCEDGDIVPVRIQTKGINTWEEYIRYVKEVIPKSKPYETTGIIEGAKQHDTEPVKAIFNYLDFHAYNQLETKAVIEAEPDISNYERASTAFDFTIVNKGNCLVLRLTYQAELFSDWQINDSIKFYENILAAILNNTKGKIENNEILGSEYIHMLLNTFNNTKAEYPKDKSIHELFEEQVKKTPENIAVVYGDSKLTYRQLNERANSLAWLLRRKGTVPDTIVGVVVEQSLEMIVGILGVLKAGGAYLPIDPGYPKDRIRYMLCESGANILLSKGKFIEKLEYNGEFIDLEDKGIYCGEKADPPQINNSKNLAYVIYTSGSTGTPKGVLIQHNALVNLCFWYIKNYNVTNKDRATKCAGFGFDASVCEIYPYIISGATIYIISEDMKLHAEKINDYCHKNGITVSFLPTRLCEQFMEYENSSLRILLTGGDKLKKFRQKNYMLVDNYGPTENTVVTTSFKVEREYANIPIGKPIDNTKIYILNRDNSLQPIGVPGELCISGDGLARGYLNSPELTAEKFVNNPYFPGERMYKTGDVARWLPDGNIEFIGRLDNQVKIRGFRIEAGEIEAILLKHEPVKEAVVEALEDKNGNKYLCGYIVSDREVPVQELRAHLAERLPGYMIPQYFVRMEKMPLNQNGKIDKKALPEPLGDINTGTEYVAPRDEVEKKLAEVWREVLKVQKTGVNDSFFELGGDSFKAALVISKVNRSVNVEISFVELFENSTISKLAEVIRPKYEELKRLGEITGQMAGKDISIQPVEKKDYYITSSAQKRMYILSKLIGEDIGYNIPMAMCVEGNLDRERFERAMKELVKRHEALRTSFELVDNEPVQRVHDEADFEIEHMEEADEEKVEGILRDFIRPFDLCKAPLMRVGLVKIREDKYMLVMDIHHIISDGVSMGVIFREIADLYKGDNLDIPGIQYKDFSIWQNTYLQSEAVKKQEEYWLNMLSGEIPVLNMITDYPRPAVQSFEGDRIEFTAGKKIVEGLRKLAAGSGSTMYMVLLAAYNVLLSKYSGQEDIIVGSPISGRPQADLQNVVGMFVNTLAMRNYPGREKTFKEFLKEVKVNALKAYENQEFQFEELVEKIGIKKDISRNPIFDTVFLLQNMDMKEIRIEGLNFKFHSMEFNISKFDLTITATEKSEGISFSLEYCTDLYKRDTAERLGVHYLKVLEQVAENWDKRIKDIEVLGEEEKNRILKDFNDTGADYPRNKTIQEIFEYQADKNPNNTAVIHGDKELTYRELNERANKLAGILREKGVKPDGIVGIIAERSPEMIVGLMAILKAGGAYLPLDPNFPEERMSFMLEDSNVSILLEYRTKETNTREWPYNSIEVLNIADEDLYEGSGENLTKVNTARDLAYIIYTSGSTGKPKGVMIEHRNIINMVKDTNCIDIKQDDRILQLSNYAFDGSKFDIYSALLNGAAIVMIDKDDAANIEKLSRIICDKGITISLITTALFNVLVDMKIESLKNMRKILSGGERVSADHVRKALKQLGPGKVIHVYGPTESTVYSTYHFVDSIGENAATIPIGKPLANTRVYIVDKNLKLQPVGVGGELCISGDGLARGYLNNPGLTGEKFINNPFEPGERMYKSGDLARWLPDGSIEFLDRIDNQVKIRGFRIELGEIEAALLKHECVKEAVVISKEDNRGSRYLCGYIVSDRELPVSELRAHISGELPDYMVPSYFIQLEKMPLNQNGKIDKKALPEPGGDINTGTEYAAPRNEAEEKLQKICEEILGVDRIGINDNFFELGGHSLKATILMSRIHKELCADIPLKEIFENPTISTMSEYIAKSAEKEGIAIEPAGKREYYPVSGSQKRIYVLSRMNAEGVQYNIPMSMYIEGVPDRERFMKVFAELVKRHESFRTSFEMVDGEVVQKIHDEADFEIEYAKEPDYEKLNGITKAFVRPFELSKAPLMRVKLVEVREDKHLLLLDIHHIISDGMSVGILFKEIAGIYRGESPAMPRIQYKDFAVWQNEYLKKAAIKKQESYWLDVLSGELPVLDIVTDYPRPAIQSFEGDRIEFRAGQEITERLRKLSAETGVTMYMALLAAYNVLLSKYSRQEDIIVGSPIAGRPYADVQNIVGMFVNTLVMRNRPAGELTFKEFLHSVKENALKAYENQEYQFEELAEKVDATRDLSRNPIFDTMFAMQNMDIKEIDIEGLKFQPYTLIYPATKFDLTLTAIEESNDISFNLEYCSKLFKRTTIERIAKHYINILRQAVLHYDKKISEIDIADEEEKKRILYEFNRTSVNYPQDKTIHELFERQAMATPEKTALVYKEKCITYSELDRKAEKLARYIRTKGIKANDVIGIITENSIELIVGIFGILKSGAAYLPIDPSYPEDRISYMLDNSNAAMLLSKKDTIKKLSVAALQRNQNKSIKGFNREIIMLDSEYGTPGIEGNLNCEGKPNDLAYVIYTSGSTGEPKGVMVEHRSVINFCEWYKNYYKITDKDKGTKYAGVGFDVSVLEIFTHLLNGAELHIIDEDIKLDMKKLSEYYKKNSISISFLPTQICEQFMLFGQAPVKQLLTGGDKLMRYIPGSYKLINNYGPTENTVVTTSYAVDNECTNIPIGKPIDNSRVYILDRYLKLQPVGLPGELCISGRSLARGYINDEELTRKKFIENPYEDGEKLYRTGDLARWLPDGNIEFLGRMDKQVKIRGFRIELGEIEQRLLKFENIAEAVAVVLEDKNGEKYICAYIVSGADIDMLKLRQYLEKQLPPYMIPAHFIRLTQIPLNQNDKIDRKRLPKPVIDNNSNAEYAAPRNEAEEMLVNIWQDVLGIDTVGIYDNFFKLGGDSIKAIRVISRLSVNYSVSANDIFENQTIAEFGKKVTKICVIERIKELGNAENEIAVFKDKDSPGLVNEQLSAQTESYNKRIQLYKDIDIHADRGYKNIMLLGSTGYLGIYILKDLLENTESNIYLLIRGDTAEAAEERLKKKIRFYFAESLYNKNKSRIIVLNGDISKEYFGLADDVYNDISDVVECIINSAGNVKHYGKYEDFYKTNVLGTRNLVNFAGNRRLKDLNHISTMSVAYGNEACRKYYYFTEYENCSGLDYDNYYVKTKQEAERIIQEARNKGINCNIYRIGNLVFNSDTGGFQENISENDFYKTMKSYIKVLAFPRIESMTFDFSPVDYVSRAIALLLAANLKNENYHVYNSNYLNMLEIGRFIKKSIPELQILDFAEFLNYLEQEYNKGVSREYIENIIFQYSMAVKEGSSRFITRSDKTNLILEKIGFKWPIVSETHISKMIEHCRAVNYFRG